jgi:hypothetical protein
MSDSQTVWKILWEHAAAGEPFEIDEVVPAVTATLKVSAPEARGLIGGLLTELDRLPDGHQYFTREGNAVVPLPAYSRARQASSSPLDVYPYEL